MSSLYLLSLFSIAGEDGFSSRDARVILRVPEFGSSKSFSSLRNSSDGDTHKTPFSPLLKQTFSTCFSSLFSLILLPPPPNFLVLSLLLVSSSAFSLSVSSLSLFLSFFLSCIVEKKKKEERKKDQSIFLYIYIDIYK
jgi:hypothetical protein